MAAKAFMAGTKGGRDTDEQGGNERAKARTDNSGGSIRTRPDTPQARTPQIRKLQWAVNNGTVAGSATRPGRREAAGTAAVETNAMKNFPPRRRAEGVRRVRGETARRTGWSSRMTMGEEGGGGRQPGRPQAPG